MPPCTSRRLIALFAAACLGLALLASACSGGGSDLPDGWKSFSQGPFKGGVEKNWTVVYVGDLSDPPEAVPESFRENLKNFEASGTITSVLLVFLDQDETFSTTVHILLLRDR